MVMRRSVRRVAPRRRLIWARNSQAGLLSDVQPQLGHDLLEDFRTQNDGSQPLGCTVTRIRMQLTLQTTLSLAGGVVAGIKVDQRNSDILAAESNPATFPHEDWMYWSWHPAVPAGAVDNPGDSVVASFDVDVRSQRKMEELGDSLFLWFGLASLVPPADDAIYNFRTSVLLKLP